MRSMAKQEHHEHSHVKGHSHNTYANETFLCWD